jgi:hypothetical protein
MKKPIDRTSSRQAENRMPKGERGTSRPFLRGSNCVLNRLSDQV